MQTADTQQLNEVAVLVATDTHAGSKYALLNPEAYYTDPATGETETYKLNSWQEWLWRSFTEVINEAAFKANGLPTMYIHDGDAVQGTKYATGLSADSIDAQIEIALANMEPVFKAFNVARFRQVVGTAAHDQEQGAASRAIARESASKFLADTKAVYHPVVNILGHKFNFAHHGPSNSPLPWTSGNGMRSYLRKMAMEYEKRGEALPEVVVRGDIHQLVEESIIYNGHEMRGVVVPAWQAPYDFVRKVVKSPEYLQVGIALWIVRRDEPLARPQWFTRMLDVRNHEEWN